MIPRLLYKVRGIQRLACYHTTTSDDAGCRRPLSIRVCFIAPTVRVSARVSHCSVTHSPSAFLLLSTAP